MTAQQSPRKEGGEIHKDLPQQGGHFLQGALQFRRDTTGGKKWMTEIERNTPVSSKIQRPVQKSHFLLIPAG